MIYIEDIIDYRKAWNILMDNGVSYMSDSVNNILCNFFSKQNRYSLSNDLSKIDSSLKIITFFFLPLKNDDKPIEIVYDIVKNVIVEGT